MYSTAFNWDCWAILPKISEILSSQVCQKAQKMSPSSPSPTTQHHPHHHFYILYSCHNGTYRFQLNQSPAPQSFEWFVLGLHPLCVCAPSWHNGSPLLPSPHKSLERPPWASCQGWYGRPFCDFWKNEWWVVLCAVGETEREVGISNNFNSNLRAIIWWY